MSETQAAAAGTMSGPLDEDAERGAATPDGGAHPAEHGDAAGRDVAPGDEHHDGDEAAQGIQGYLIGLGLAGILTAASFLLPTTGLVWGPAVPMALIVLAVAQMGVHLVFFLHINSAPDSTNNIMALAFGVLIVFLLVAGSVWIMTHLNHNMIPMDQLMQMQR